MYVIQLAGNDRWTGIVQGRSPPRFLVDKLSLQQAPGPARFLDTAPTYYRSCRRPKKTSKTSKDLLMLMVPGTIVNKWKAGHSS